MRLTGAVLLTKAAAGGRGRLVRLHPPRARRHARRARDRRLRPGHRARRSATASRSRSPGRCIPIVGRVAMDVCVVDIGDAAVRRGDEVVFFGERPRRPSLAEWVGAPAHAARAGHRRRPARAAGVRRDDRRAAGRPRRLRARTSRAIRGEVAPAEHMLVVKDDAYGHGLRADRATRVGGGVALVRRVRRADRTPPCAPRSAPTRGSSSGSSATASEAQPPSRSDLDVGVGDAALLEDVARSARDAAPRASTSRSTPGLHRNGVRPEEWAPRSSHAPPQLERPALDRGGRRVEPHRRGLGRRGRRRARRRSTRRVDAAPSTPDCGPRLRHLAASAAAFARPEFRYDLVRDRRVRVRHPARRRSRRGASSASVRSPPSRRRSSAVDGDAVHDRHRRSLHGLPSTLGGPRRRRHPGRTARAARASARYASVVERVARRRRSATRSSSTGGRRDDRDGRSPKPIGTIGEEIAAAGLAARSRGAIAPRT